MNIKISKGIITSNGKHIGTVFHELKFGYHPAILAKVGGKSKWFECDEPDLMAKISDFARDAAK